MVGDLATAEDAVQEACVAALVQWSAEGQPANPRAWLIGVARNKAIDRIRRDARRREKEAAALLEWEQRGTAQATDPLPDDELNLIFMCCHPALDPAARIALTLRSVCGLSTAEVAAVFVVPEPTMAKRLGRTRRKIRDAGIPFRTPGLEAFADRLDAVLRVVYLVFTEGHKASAGANLVRGELCDTAVRLARTLVALLPGEPEVAGLLSLLLLTDARRAARIDAAGELVLLDDQDRHLWDQAMIKEGDHLLEQALRARRPGPYQLHAAIAACHSTARHAAHTDWRQIALLYGELVRYEPNPVIEANRAIAVAMADGPAAGLVILDTLSHHPQLSRWPQLHIARADLLRRLGRNAHAQDAYRTALQLNPSLPERTFIIRRIDQLKS
ncbi:MAG: polymerase subunit sigma-24 [Actinomycetia bacterium]|nr:polymerase subunit sigma-24 [Actinomycetes bacterium]